MKKQTKEVIDIINNDQIPTIVAINKIDVHSADIEGVEDSLFEAGLNIEPRGGNIPVVHISAKTGQNIDLLSELIIEETSELKAFHEGLGEGIVLEAYQNKQELNAMTMIVKQGRLKPGSILIIGDESTKIRNMQDDSGRELKEAFPGDAVHILGIPSIPTAGDFIYEVEDEIKAKYITSKKKQVLAEESQKEKSKNNLKGSKLTITRREKKVLYKSGDWMSKFNEK